MALELSGDIAGLGKIVQIVRATDTSLVTTSSTSYVDTGLSITITPNKSTSTVLLVATFQNAPTGTAQYVRITDNSSNAISGAEQSEFGSLSDVPATLIAYATPATTSAVTYKLQYKTSNNLARIAGSVMTSQMFAIEVAA